MSRESGARGFGALLREHRLAAALTQEALAQRGGVSPRAIQHLEAGDAHPTRATLQRLVQGLELAAVARTAFEAAAAPRPHVRGAGNGVAARPPPSNLPAPRTALIGRAQEVATLRNLVRRGGTRLVTLTGVGGVGKTGVALHVADAVRGAFPNGVWLVELAPVADPAQVPHAVAAILGVRAAPGVPLLDALVTILRSRALLLVLDNCEHLLDACAALAGRVLDACPGVRLLATSREPLQITGEVQRRLAPLAVPDAGEAASVDDLARCPAVRLFVERARASAPAFRLVPENAPAVAEVCIRLDGIPLALELAAARVRVLAVEQILARLADSVRLLTGGSRAGPGRQQTLRATLDWSHALLTGPERTAFRRLGTFPGGFDLEAAEAVCSAAGGGAAPDGGPPATAAAVRLPASDLGRDEVLDVLGRLVDKSLVVAEGGSSGPLRYRLLEPLRQYARERLEDSGEAGAARQRHATHYAGLAEDAPAGLRGRERGLWRARLDPEHDNLRAALDWLEQRGEADPGLRLATAVAILWSAGGYPADADARLARLLALPGPVPPRTRADALRAAGDLAWARSDYRAQQRYCQERLAIYRALGERAGIAHALADLAAPLHLQGHYPEARALLEESLALYRELEAGPELGSPLTKLANVARDQGDYLAARPLYDEALARYREAGDRLNAGHVLSNLGWLALYQGDLPAARAWQEESLALRREIGYGRDAAVSLTVLGKVAAAAGDPAAARTLYEESLPLHRAMGNQWGVVLALEGLAELAVPAQPLGALRLAGAADALREATGRRRPPAERPAYDRWLARARAAAGAGAAAAWEAGRAMPLQEAVAGAPAAPGASVAARGGLTPREHEVARLIAAGCRSDRQLAARLTVTPGTAGVHVQRILEKLGLHSRWQIADWASGQSLPDWTPERAG
jgi:non-specific serine/threonine protein kinase